MSEYDHISFEEREQIAIFRQQGYGPSRIGRELGRHCPSPYNLGHVSA